MFFFLVFDELIFFFEINYFEIRFAVVHHDGIAYFQFLVEVREVYRHEILIAFNPLFAEEAELLVFLENYRS